MKTLSEHVRRSYIVKIVKEFEIELDNDETLQVTKWWDADEIKGYDNDYEIDPTNKKEIFDKLSEEEQDKVMDFINKLT